MAESQVAGRLVCVWIPGDHLVVRLPSDDSMPAWTIRPAGHPGCFSVTQRGTERSVCCPAEFVPAGVECIGPYRALEVQSIGSQAVPLPSNLIGLLARMTTTLADQGIPVLAISTFETDVLLVPCAHAGSASVALGMAQP